MTRIITTTFISLFAFVALAVEETSGIGFESVADIQVLLQQNIDASIHRVNDWTIIRRSG